MHAEAEGREAEQEVATAGLKEWPLQFKDFFLSQSFESGLQLVLNCSRG